MNEQWPRRGPGIGKLLFEGDIADGVEDPEDCSETQSLIDQEGRGTDYEMIVDEDIPFKFEKKTTQTQPKEKDNDLQMDIEEYMDTKETFEEDETRYKTSSSTNSGLIDSDSVNADTSWNEICNLL